MSEKEPLLKKENLTTEKSKSFLRNRRLKMLYTGIFAVAGVMNIAVGAYLTAHGIPSGPVFITAGMLLLIATGIYIKEINQNKIIKR